jgi:hypothetical protein
MWSVSRKAISDLVMRSAVLFQAELVFEGVVDRLAAVRRVFRSCVRT